VVGGVLRVPVGSSFSAPLTSTAGMALDNGRFEPGGYQALLERFIVGEIQRRAEAEPDHVPVATQ
jgi:hypothetical protein